MADGYYPVGTTLPNGTKSTINFKVQNGIYYNTPDVQAHFAEAAPASYTPAVPASTGGSFTLGGGALSHILPDRPNVPGEEARGGVMGLHGLQTAAQARLKASTGLGGTGISAPTYVPPAAVGYPSGPQGMRGSSGDRTPPGLRVRAPRRPAQVADVTNVAAALPGMKKPRRANPGV